MIEVAKTDKAPAAIDPYNQALKYGNLLFTSGQIPLDPESSNIVGDNISSQAKQVLDNLSTVLDAGGAKLEQVIKTTCYLNDMNDFSDFNELYKLYFNLHHPARSCVAAKQLPLGVLIEIEAIAVI